MRLGSWGPSLCDPLASTAEDNAIIADLKLAATEANKEGSNFDNEGHLLSKKSSSDKGSWGSCIRYFFKDISAGGGEKSGEKSILGPMYGEDIYLAAFVSYFLSFFVLPGHPADMPSPFVFPLVVRLVQSEAIPLGPLFLGNLYHRLDSLHADMERSSRRCEVLHVPVPQRQEPPEKTIAKVQVGMAYYPILEEVERVCPNAFSHLFSSSPIVTLALLEAFVKFLKEAWYARMDNLDASRLRDYLVALKDFDSTGIDVSWLRPRFELKGLTSLRSLNEGLKP
ncbi:hypothetical protein Vadar_022659 [Vaccinium darrowii]|uniref:Uncharacterized protein n=1 Tax=Vaccinium darrowii TaxID=229202 RepID=A0ACB7XK11_9ERIC|nr:hypothetical protein Vadar_022659 [Vaccinium darrowii]